VYVDICVEPRFYTSVFYFSFIFFYIYIYIYIRVATSASALAHPLSYSMVTGVQGHFVGAKWPEHEIDLSFPSNA